MVLVSSANRSMHEVSNCTFIVFLLRCIARWLINQMMMASGIGAKWILLQIKDEPPSFQIYTLKCLEQSWITLSASLSYYSITSMNVQKLVILVPVLAFISKGICLKISQISTNFSQCCCFPTFVPCGRTNLECMALYIESYSSSFSMWTVSPMYYALPMTELA